MAIKRGVDMGVVAMPWRPQPDRSKIQEVVRTWWEEWGFTIFTADSDPELPFSLSEARNNAVRKVQESDFGNGVVILADADTIPDRLVVSKAADIAAEAGHVVYPFNEYRYLGKNWVDELARRTPYDLIENTDLSKAVPIWVKDNSVGGILVTHTETYWELGGMDEKFERTWGFEDNAFVAVADTLAKVIRLPGKVYSFEHDVEGLGRDWTQLNPNYWRNELYQKCYGNVKLMRELIR